jgi:hypothetical protein
MSRGSGGAVSEWVLRLGQLGQGAWRECCCRRYGCQLAPGSCPVTGDSAAMLCSRQCTHLMPRSSYGAASRGSTVCAMPAAQACSLAHPVVLQLPLPTAPSPSITVVHLPPPHLAPTHLRRYERTVDRYQVHDEIFSQVKALNLNLTLRGDTGWCPYRWPTLCQGLPYKEHPDAKELADRGSDDWLPLSSYDLVLRRHSRRLRGEGGSSSRGSRRALGRRGHGGDAAQHAAEQEGR